MAPTRSILLVDDHGLVRHGVELLVNKIMPSAHVVLAGSLQEADEALSSGGRFDVALLDLTLGDVQGTAGLRRLHEKFPYLPIVVVSAQDDAATVQSAFEIGAMGFISKSAPPEELRTALSTVLVSQVAHFPKSISNGLSEASRGTGRDLSELEQQGFTERQIEVVRYVVLGLPNKEIARKLGVSEQNVKQLVTRVLRTMGVPNRTRLLISLSQQGYRVPLVSHEAAAG